MDPRIVKYYRLCAISAPRIHPVANLDDAAQVVTGYEQKLYFMNSKGALVPKETVIGGWNGGDGNIARRQKIIVF
jgi:hypothetical protein